jgi:transcriptional activator SPT7
MTPDGISSHKTHGGKRVKKSDIGEDMDMDNTDDKMMEEMDDDMAELQDQVWRDTTKKTRAKLTVSKWSYFHLLFY